MPDESEVNEPALGDIDQILTDAPISRADDIAYPEDKGTPEKPPPPRPDKEINIWGSYSQGPWKTDEEIIAAINKKTDEWFPGSIELLKFAKSGKGTVEGAVNVWNLLCSIARNKPTRVNIFTHACSDTIGFKGSVVKGNVYFETAKEEYTLSVELMKLAEEEGYTFSDDKNKDVTMSQVRKALGKDAHIYIYACHVGLGTSYVTSLANFFAVTVHASTKDMRFHPIVSKDGKTIKSWKYSAGSGDRHSDFHSITLDVAIKPAKKAAP